MNTASTSIDIFGKEFSSSEKSYELMKLLKKGALLAWVTGLGPFVLWIAIILLLS